MKRVVITGMGIVSCLGNTLEQVSQALRQGRSGIRYKPEYQQAGLRSHVAGSVQIDLEQHIDRKTLRFMGDSAAYSHIALQQAIAQSGLSPQQVSHPRTGIIAGSGGASTCNQIEAIDTLRQRGIKRVGPYRVTQTMGSTVSACLATPFAIKGVNYSISSACATSAHCIGNACELIQLGKQDIVFAGGGEEEHWSMSALFDAMGALSTGYNDCAQQASRPYDTQRDGFVIAGGSGMLVLESLEHALARGARIYAELTGYGATSDGYSMVAPSGEGAVRCMQQALQQANQHSVRAIDYINTHGTSTPVGDTAELAAIQSLLAACPDDPDSPQAPWISSTKSMTGHSLGATGVH